MLNHVISRPIMPIHVTNRLTVQGDHSIKEKFFESISNGIAEDGSPVFIDFNKILPVPDSLNIENCSKGFNGLTVVEALEHQEYSNLDTTLSYSWISREGIFTREQLIDYLLGKFPDCQKLGRIYYDNIQMHGIATGYEWKKRNWGTNYNAFKQRRIGEDNIAFLTTGGGVPNIIKILAARFPELTLCYKYADVEHVTCVGAYRYENGNCVEENLPDELFSTKGLAIVKELLSES